MSAPAVAMREAFGEALLSLAEKFPELVVLDADVSGSTRTCLFGAKYPDRFFNMGVAEANMTDVAAGMATCGLRPVVSTFAIFLGLKATDQIRNIICYNKLPVILAGNYAGTSDSFDGASHQSLIDISIMRAMPNMTVIVPVDGLELAQAVEAALRLDGPAYIRICRNPTPALFAGQEPFEIGKIRNLRHGDDLTIAVCGVPTFMAIEAADRLEKQGVSVDLLEVSTIKPIDVEALTESARRTQKVLTVEEHTVVGGLGSAVAEVLAQHAPSRMRMIGIQDTFTESGDWMGLMRKHGISTENIESVAIQLVRAPQ
jgi:transketolase